MKLLTNAWGYPPFRWGAIITGLTAATLLLLPGLHIGDYSASRFLPHATCYLRDPGLIWLNVISDSFIALAYLSISATLGYLVVKARRDIPFHWMFGAFGLFIVTCGFTHVLSVVTVWRPVYWLAGDVKAITAVASVATAIVLPITVPRVFSMIHDAKVSEQRKHELVIAHERLKQSDELKSHFFANVSHELRTPLTLILGPLRKRLATADLSPDERRDLEVAERNAGLLLQQVNNLLDLAKIDARSMQPQYAAVDMAEMVRLVGSYFEVMAVEQEMSFEIVTPDHLIGEADRDKVERIVMNLLSNAFKFTPAGGRIRCQLTEDGGDALVTVEDSGPGIPEDMRTAVLERFRQIDGGAKRRVGGTGLGLAIVNEFADLHGGSLEIGAAALGGARVEVRIPLAAPAGTPVQARPPSSEAAATRHAVDELRTYRPAERRQPGASADRALVLVVEDNPDMNAFVADTLADHYDVATAFSGEEGLQQAQRLVPDLIVTDLMMPGMSGGELIERLRRLAPFEETPIVVLTARADEQERIQLLQMPVQDYVTKPFAPEELVARVDELVRQRRSTVEKLREVNASLERRVAERTQQVEEQAEQLRRMAAELGATEQRERRRLAQALHDHLQQLLVSAKMGLEQSLLGGAQRQDVLERVGHALDEALAASRSITLELYPPVLYDRGLSVALQWLARHTEERHPLAISVQSSADVHLDDDDLQSFLFSSVRELLLNAVKHARASSVAIEIQLDGEWLTITVADDGVGCDADEIAASRSSEGFGLFNIRERLRVLGGRFEMGRQAEGGCRITLECPV